MFIDDGALASAWTLCGHFGKNACLSVHAWTYYIWKCAHLDIVTTGHKERSVFVSFRLCAIWMFGTQWKECFEP